MVGIKTPNSLYKSQKIGENRSMKDSLDKCIYSLSYTQQFFFWNGQIKNPSTYAYEKREKKKKEAEQVDKETKTWF